MIAAAAENLIAVAVRASVFRFTNLQRSACGGCDGDDLRDLSIRKTELLHHFWRGGRRKTRGRHG
jgi:hypothetical protein